MKSFEIVDINGHDIYFLRRKMNEKVTNKTNLTDIQKTDFK